MIYIQKRKKTTTDVIKNVLRWKLLFEKQKKIFQVNLMEQNEFFIFRRRCRSYPHKDYKKVPFDSLQDS